MSFNCNMVVDVRWAGLSILETANLLGITGKVETLC